jgi:hypothetical protein
MVASLALAASVACSTINLAADSLGNEMGSGQISLRKARAIRHVTVRELEHADDSCEGTGRLDDLLFDIDELIWFRTHSN